jgi:hypothetical protein
MRHHTEISRQQGKPRPPSNGPGEHARPWAFRHAPRGSMLEIKKTRRLVQTWTREPHGATKRSRAKFSQVGTTGLGRPLEARIAQSVSENTNTRHPVQTRTREPHVPTRRSRATFRTAPPP